MMNRTKKTLRCHQVAEGSTQPDLTTSTTQQEPSRICIKSEACDIEDSTARFPGRFELNAAMCEVAAVTRRVRLSSLARFCR